MPEHKMTGPGAKGTSSTVQNPVQNPVDYLNALLAAPFPTFTFSAVGVCVYQFGNFGTAAKLLRSFKLAQ
jgi:hypothetical protein